MAIRFAFSGFAALAPVMLAALFWKRSTKYGALASVLWVIVTMLGTFYLYDATTGIAPRPGQPPVPIFPALGDLFLLSHNWPFGSAVAIALVAIMLLAVGLALRWAKRQGGQREVSLL